MRRALRGALAPDPARFLAAAIVASAVVAFVAAAAGLARVLPILLDPEVPRRAARPFLVGLLALSVEIGALVGWPLGFVEAAIRSVERGEARARMALGEGPGRRVARLWPALIALSVAMAVGSLAWGRDARAPGRVARALVEEARVACEAEGQPRVVDVPLVRASWLCRPGRPPLLLGEGTGGSLDFLAGSFHVADDLSAVTLKDAQVLLATETPTRLRLGEARVIHLVPFSAPSSVPPVSRASAMVVAALVSAVLAVISALRSESPHRAIAWAVSIAGPAATLATLRACERAEISDARLVSVPLAAVAATLLARAAVLVARRAVARRRARYAPSPS
ncbi:MAG: hypothetical protein HYV09_26250 [Deltaproteobacteria bacterium]|nr:hypothetical protein [Deltaproteobacteria bacterium]